jgi:hypothetical protein
MPVHPALLDRGGVDQGVQMRGKLIHAVALVLLGVLVGGGAYAGAQSLITSRNIRDNSIQNRDIRTSAITMSRLAPTTQQLIRQGGVEGPAGQPGGPGAPGAPGSPGAPGGAAPEPPAPKTANFGLENRGTIGSPLVMLRTGPGDPPFGSGSLNLSVRNDERVAFGLHVRGPVNDIEEIGFSVFTTGENIAAGGGGSNMPSLTFEIDPNLGSLPNVNFASLVWNPPNSAPSAWSRYIDATTTGFWGLSGAAFNNPPTAENCGLNGPRCSFTQVMALLNDGGDPAEAGTFAVTKGRDFQFSGAVDGVRVNNIIVDFEPAGAILRSAS